MKAPLPILNIVIYAASLVLLAGASAPLPADGESRPATAAEKAFIAKTLTALEKAIPAPHPGWEVADQSDTVPPERMGLGAEESPLLITYSARWRDPAKLAEADRKLAEKSAAMGAVAESDEATKQMEQRMEELAQAIGAAAEKGDFAEMQRLQGELDTVAARLNPVYDQKDAEVDRMVAEIEPRDAQVDIWITANTFNINSPGGRPTTSPLPNGLVVYRTEGGRHPGIGWEEGISLVALGDFRVTDDGEYVQLEADPDPKKPHTAVQTLLIQVQADGQRAAEILNGMDWAGLKSLL